MNSRPPSSVRMIDLAGAVACAGVTAAAFLLGFQPLMHREAGLQQTRATLAARRAEAKDLSRSLADARRQMASIEAAVARNPLRLRPGSELNARLTLVTRTAADNAVQIDRLEPGLPQPRTHFVTVPIRVGGRGGYADLARLLHQLHHTAADTAVASIGLRGQPGISGAAATFDLELVWHAAPTDAHRDTP